MPICSVAEIAGDFVLLGAANRSDRVGVAPLVPVELALWPHVRRWHGAGPERPGHAEAPDHLLRPRDQVAL